MDLWYWKQPLCHLSHNNYSQLITNYQGKNVKNKANRFDEISVGDSKRSTKAWQTEEEEEIKNDV